ncbi:class I SAM-dependent methyltransferase [Primorskyibacter sp. S187A]|uniref:class I SAM-dependent methyltransferase n=1 Tax=Primorskyibacter sp. S187A TaxID=3415130 RepID=UPI003C7C7C4F
MTSVAFWDKVAEKYARDPIEDMAAYVETRERMRARLKPSHRVLELGCGTGTTALELAGDVAHYHATDISGHMIDIAKRKHAAANLPHLHFSVAPAEGLPEGPHDVILALNLLHLVDDKHSVLRSIHGKLPAGGLFFAKTAVLKDGAWFLPWIIPAMRLIGKAPLVRSFSQTDLVAAIEAAGFVIEDTYVQPGTAPRVYTAARKV